MYQQVNDLGAKLQFWHRKALPVMTQTEAAECGLTCLAMVTCYHGQKMTLSDIRRQFNVSINGLTLMDIMQFSEKLELTSRPLRVEMDDLQHLQTPCILHWDLNHFVVLKSANSKQVVIHDPAYGVRKLSYQQASEHFTGVALELLPTKNFEKKETGPSLKFSDLWSKIVGLKRSLALVFAWSLLIQVFALAAPYYMQLVIDEAVFSGDLSLLPVLALGFFFVLIFDAITNALRGLTLLQFGSRMNIQMGANLFHHLIRLPLSFFEKRHMGDIVSRFGSLHQVREMLTTGVIEAIIDGLMASITLVVIFMYSPLLSFVVLAAVSCYALIRIVFYRQFRLVSEQEIKAKAEENSYFMETVRGAQTIKIFGSEAKREGHWQNLYAESINKSIRLGNFQISYDLANKLLFGIENIVVVYLAATMIIAGGFSTGMLFAFMAYKGQFMQKMSGLIEKYIAFKMLGLHFERIADIALTEKEQLLANHQSSQHQIKGSLEIENVTFRYSDATPNIIENQSLTIREGESVAITGPSGCGKSTLVKILLGLIKPQEGQIKIDGKPLEQLGYGFYRSQVAAVMQEDAIFSGSITENIAFFEPNIDMQKLIRCAKDAAIHQDIEKMPMGYESLIGDMGSSLSGGQKQRLILARALYREPKILFMDEATSHLDTELEATINESIQKLAITRVIIAHRKETIASADREVRLKPDEGLAEVKSLQQK